MSMPKRVRARTWRPPLPRPVGAQTPQKQHAGLLELDAQPSAASIRPLEGAARKVSAPVRRAYIPDTSAAPGPEPGTWKDPDPRRRSRRGSGGSEWACLPGDGGYATPAGCPVSTTSWRYGLRRTRRLVDDRSPQPRSAWPDQARLPLLAVTHRYKPTPCLWLEQFQIAESVRLCAPRRQRRAEYRSPCSGCLVRDRGPRERVRSRRASFRG
jgi:hypothetical protein